MILHIFPIHDEIFYIDQSQRLGLYVKILKFVCKTEICTLNKYLYYDNRRALNEKHETEQIGNKERSAKICSRAIYNYYYYLSNDRCSHHQSDIYHANNVRKKSEAMSKLIQISHENNLICICDQKNRMNGYDYVFPKSHLKKI